jgi:hypothetical protein
VRNGRLKTKWKKKFCLALKEVLFSFKAMVRAAV